MRRLENYLPTGLATLFTLLAIAEVAWPQPTPASPTFEARAGYALVVFVLVVGLMVAMGFAVKLYDLKRKREDEGIAVQARLTDMLLSDPMLAGLPITPTVHVPFSRSAATVITLTGTVPSQGLRETAIRMIEREAASMRTDYRIEERLHVDPRMSRRAA